MKIRLLIVDDHNLMIRGLEALLADYKELKVVATASNGREALKVLKTKKVDVVITDYEMNEMDGLEFTRQVNLKYPDIRIIVLTMHSSEELIYQLIDKGARAFLRKDFDSEGVVDAIYNVIENGYHYNDHLNPNLLHKLLTQRAQKPKLGISSLSDREIQIVRWICEEKTNKEISEMLGVSIRTVEGYRYKVIIKLNVKNTAGIVLYAIKNNIIY